MNLTRVTAPVGPVVDLEDLKQHLRVSGSDSDMIIANLEKAAVAHLDGWRGVLGRCIQEQTWKVSFSHTGTFHLPFPDITSVSGGVWNASGKYVTLDNGTDVTFTCALPEDAMWAVQQAIKVWVSIHYDKLSGPEYVAHQATFDGLISPIRWGGV